jgi:predicted CopG family antitoxin
MIQQMEESLKRGRKLIDTELDTGILNFIVRPIVKAFYDFWAMHDARKGTLKQIDVTLDAGKQLLLNGKSEESFSNIVEEYVPKYLKADQVTYQCSKHHENYEILKENARETFINYLEEVRTFLSVEEDVNEYSELARVAFKTKELATMNLMKQLELTEHGIKFSVVDPSILSLPAGKKIIIKALRKGFEETKKEFLESIDDTYD